MNYNETSDYLKGRIMAAGKALPETQQEFGLNIQILMDLGMVEEIPVPPNRINTTGQGTPYFYIEDIQEEK